MLATARGSRTGFACLTFSSARLAYAGILTQIVIAVLTLLAGSPSYAEIDEASGDLLAEIISIRSNIPGAGSEAFELPSSSELVIWREIVDALLEDDAQLADSLVSTHFPDYRLFLFTDTGFDSSCYYLLRETYPVSLGWGTLITRIDCEREIAVEVPHPLYDINTPSEGIDVFRQVGGRLFVMAGTHRCANRAISPCDGSSSVCGDGRYHESDMAHFADAPFEVSHEAFTGKYPWGYSFSLHGSVRSECQDVFLSNGHESDSHEILYDLKDNMIASGDITVAVAGDGSSSCPLYGTTNVQGRHANGSQDPCFEEASSATGFFIHAEQRRRVRDSLSVYSKLIDAIKETIPPIQASGPIGVERFAALDLSLPHPNPCVSEAELQLTVARSQRVRIEVFDVGGRRFAVLFNRIVPAGQPQSIAFKAAGLASGIYFLRASGDDGVATRAVTVVNRTTK